MKQYCTKIGLTKMVRLLVSGTWRRTGANISSISLNTLLKNMLVWDNTSKYVYVSLGDNRDCFT